MQTGGPDSIMQKGGHSGRRVCGICGFCCLLALPFFLCVADGCRPESGASHRISHAAGSISAPVC